MSDRVVPTLTLRTSQRRLLHFRGLFDNRWMAGEIKLDDRSGDGTAVQTA